MFLLATIPAPGRNVIEIGPLDLHIYGLIIGLSVVLAINVFERMLRADGVSTDRLMGLLLPAVLMGFVGARLYHVASEVQHYRQSPGDIVKVWEGGLGIYGGVLFGVVTGVVLCRRLNVPRLAALDAVAPAFLIAQALGRWGNYFNQELFGRPSDAPWALEVDAVHRPTGFTQFDTFHPTFLYESLANLVLFVVIVALHRSWRTRAPGVLFPIYIAAYSLVRYFVEGLRIDPAHTWMGMRQNEWIALGLFVVATAVAAIMQTLHAQRPPERHPLDPPGAAPAPPLG
jgi:prolipoprotein diacylglyceryl transferase